MLTPMPYESEVIRREDAGFILMLWRRQGHKTTTMAKKALKYMMKHKGITVTFCSASLLVGKELLVREGQIIESAREKVLKDAQVLKEAFTSMHGQADQAGLKLETNADGLSLDDFAEIFEQQRLEARVWHSKTVYSRTLIIAPNIATARGFSGYVFIDEIGHIVWMKDLWEAMEPIASSQQGFRVIMAGTPPNDDAHYSYELSVPPEGMTFQPDPAGHWYMSQAGVLVHRADTYDTAAAGLKTYDLNTREEITPEQHRAKALDRDAWDRNYALIFKSGGTAAVSLAAIHVSMQRGIGKCVFAEDSFPLGWRDLLTDGPIALGYDVATTEDGMSNPSSLTIMEKVGADFLARLKIIWKTTDPDIARGMLREGLELGRDRRARRLCIDASNEKYYAVSVKKEFGGMVIVELVVSSETTTYGGEKMNFKTYLGNQLVNTMDDGHLILPESRYVKEDYRLVLRDRGGFATQTDSQGRHGDTFDSDKLALHGLISRGGPARAEAVSVGGIGRSPNSAWSSRSARLADAMERGGKLNV